MWKICVHKYSYTQDKRRRNLKILAKEGWIKFLGYYNSRFHYEIPDIESMKVYTEYKNKRIKLDVLRNKFGSRNNKSWELL